MYFVLHLKTKCKCKFKGKRSTKNVLLPNVWGGGGVNLSEWNGPFRVDAEQK